VHKLDRDTSGVMVIAKNQVAFDELKSQFVGHTTKKEYVALVEGDITLWEDDALANVKTFTINAPLGRNKKEYRQSTIPSNPRGEFREAITRVELLKVGDAVTLVKLLPKTGRTHQLRAHMSSVGHPIVGDVAYGSKVKSERILLHAKSLTFVSGGKELIFETELPAEFSI
jgi:23S rRNA-/tRNA-specific pseudouridylate synthase